MGRTTVLGKICCCLSFGFESEANAEIYRRFNIPINYSVSWSIDIFGEEDEKKAKVQVKIGNEK